MQPYFQTDGVTIYHGDCREMLATLAPGSIDLVLTDPPYSERTHTSARTAANRALTSGGTTQPLIDFPPLSDLAREQVFARLGVLARRWVIATLDYRHAVGFEATPPAGLRFVRLGVWVKPNGAPQFTGDRPAQGWEAVAIMHSAGARLRWNGGGQRAVWTAGKVSTAHPTGKPLPLVREWVRLFSDPGDLVLDPFCGSGTTLLAARLEGRRAIGIEIEKRYCELTAGRLQRGDAAMKRPLQASF